MKKYFFMAIAVLASLTACQQNEPEAIVNDGTIKFMSAQTRATETTELKDLEDNGFKVYAYTGATTTYDVFSGALATPITKPSTENVTIWNTDVTKYWAINQTYDFLCVYPNNITATRNGRVNTVSFTNDGTVDYVAAVATCTTITDLAINPVALTFNHQLARVAIKFANKFTADEGGFTIKVSNVALKALPNVATFTYTNGTTTSVTATGSADMALTFDKAVDNIMTISATTDATTVYKYIVPTTASTVYKLTYKVEIYNGNELLNTFDQSTEGVDLSSIQFTAGQSYLFTANVYDVINPIKFTVNVTPWPTTDTPAGNITIGQEKQ